MIAPAEVIRPSSRDVRRLRAPRTLRAPKRDGKYRITPDLRRQAPPRALEGFEPVTERSFAFPMPAPTPDGRASIGRHRKLRDTPCHDR